MLLSKYRQLSLADKTMLRQSKFPEPTQFWEWVNYQRDQTYCSQGYGFTQHYHNISTVIYDKLLYSFLDMLHSNVHLPCIYLCATSTSQLTKVSAVFTNMAGGSLYIVPNHNSVTSVLTHHWCSDTILQMFKDPSLPLQPLPRPPPPTFVIPHPTDVTQPPPRASLTLILQATLPGVNNVLHYNSRSNPVEEIGFLEVFVNPK